MREDEVFRSRFDAGCSNILADCVLRLQAWLNQDVINILSGGNNDLPMPPAIAELNDSLEALSARLRKNRREDMIEVELRPPLIRVLRRALMFYRRERAVEIENRKQQVHHPDLLNAIERELYPINALINQHWLTDVEPVSMPSLVDYISTQKAEATLRDKGTKLPDRAYDEKFHILQAPQLFFKDLLYYRTMCEMRGVSAVIAYVDIDDFKRLNTQHGHPNVDRNILPRFMEALEAHLFCHGWAYRYGGDEYVLILPNMSSEEANRSLQSLRGKVAALEYRDIEERTTVSIGFCVIDPHSSFTDRELESKANGAMNFAKKAGKNCVATYRSPQLDDGELYITTS